MTMLNPPSRRDLLLGMATLATAGAAWAGTPTKLQKSISDDGLEKLVPDQVGPWTFETASGLVLPPPDQLARLLYDQQVARTYVAPGRPPIMLLLAYGNSQGGMLQIHRPEVCYPASGFELSDSVETTIPLASGYAIPARRFTARSDTRVEQVLYWTRIGNYLPVSWVRQRLAVMYSNFAGYVPDGLLVRASLISDDPVSAQQTLTDFIRAMLQGMTLAERRMLIGSNAT
jgi:EpsI family protein